MANTDRLDDIPRAVKNETFYLIARLCMIVATAIGLPVAGFMMSRVIAKADDIDKSVIQQNINVQLLKQTVETYVKNTDRILLDHETRLRGLERSK